MAAQFEDLASLHNWLRQAVATRQRLPEFGRGSCRLIPTDDRRVVALCASWRGRETVAAHNLSGAPCTDALDLGPGRGTSLHHHFADQACARPRENRGGLAPYGFRWLEAGAGG